MTDGGLRMGWRNGKRSILRRLGVERSFWLDTPRTAGGMFSFYGGPTV